MKRAVFYFAALAISLFFIINAVYERVVAFQAAPLMVINTNNDGPGSLRAAITAANMANGNSAIQFNIPRTDPGFNGTIFRIRVMSALPAINRDNTIIDGATQTAATGDSNPLGPEIVLDGSLAASGADGIILSSNGNNLRSIVIQNFIGGDGIRVNDNNRNNIVTNCFVGTDETGRIAAGNGTGIRIVGGANSNIIGGSLAAGNIVSGNLGDGIVITGVNSDNNTVAGNIIGLDSSATLTPLPNLGDGIQISGAAKANVIGGANAGNLIGGNMGNGIRITGQNTMGNRVMANSIGTIQGNQPRGNNQSGILFADGADTNTVGDVSLGNVIAFNGSDGVTVGTGAGSTGVLRNRITRNSIFSNGGLGIDLGANGVTNNDNGDGDSGPNNFQNFPVLTNVNVVGSSFTVTGTIDTPNPSTVTIEVYTSLVPIPAGDPSGFGEGQNFVASVIPNAMGNFTATFISNPNVVVTLLAIDSTGNTSEFSSFQVGVGGNTADLQVRNLRVTPATADPGDPIRVEFTVTNAGNANAAASTVEVRSSADNVIDMNDALLDSRNVGQLMGNGTTQFSLDLRLPNTLQPGPIFIGVVADARNAVMESNEMNNTATVSVSVSGNIDFDLINLTLNPTTGSPGTSVTLNSMLMNRGTLPAPTATVEVRLSNDQNINSNDSLLGTFTSPMIAPGQAATLTFTTMIPMAANSGRVFVGLIVDPGNQVTESAENNNTISAPFTVADTMAPRVTVRAPNGGEALPAATTFMITWTASDDTGITSQDIQLSTDGGVSFPQVIATGLAGNVRAFAFNVPMINTATAQVRIVARDAAGNMGSDTSDANFTIGLRPVIINPVFSDGKLKILASGSNILPNAQLIVVNGTSRETYTLQLNGSGTRFIIKKSQLGTPSNLPLRQVLPTGVTLMFIVRNSNGIESLPVAFQRQ